MMTGRDLLKRLHCVCDVCGRRFVEPAYLSLMPRFAHELKTCGPCLDWADRDGTLQQVG